MFKCLTRNGQGFTLTELVIVIVIIGVIATLAIPYFTTSQERARGKEAIINLKLMAAAEKIYRMESGNYYPLPGQGEQSVVGQINSDLKLSLTEANWDYSINNTNGFTARAKRLPGYGSYSNCEYSLAANDADGEPNYTSACPQ
jgi:prepilin-type N-terminal cleavage/methylation domain-containing protein